MIRKIGLIVCVCFPNNIKIFIYNHLFGFKIKNSKIGFTIFFSDYVEMEDSEVGNFNIISSKKFVMKKRAKIINFNVFSGNKQFNDSSFYLGEGSHITSHHYFDCSGSIQIEKQVVIAGRGVQIWTHQISGLPGSRGEAKPVHISNKVYIGAEVKIVPGVTVGSKNIIALGSVVTKKSGVKDSVLIMGNPGKIVKEI